jgi:NitT/TauT family transport system substrate-binding protein
MSWANLAITKTMLKDEGFELQKDYEFLPVGVGAAAFRALDDGSIATLNLFDTFHTQMENNGTKLRRLPVQDKYRRLFSNGWIAHEDTLRDRPEMVVKFARAAAKGVVACNANPEACEKNFWSLYPDTKPSQGSEEKKLADAVRIVQVRLKTMIPQEGVSQMGNYTEQSLKDYVNVLYAGGQIPTDQIPVQNLYTNEFVKKINDFDVNSVVAAAKAK